MLANDTREGWQQFLNFVKEKCSATAFNNWLSPINVLQASEEGIELEVPNIFVQDYLLSNYKKDLCSFLPVKSDGTPAILFMLKAAVKEEQPKEKEQQLVQPAPKSCSSYRVKLNDNYRFSTFVEGSSNQFVKSAALGVAAKPGKSYNPLFIHGGVGLGKTHILHSIGHYILENHNLRVQCITTEMFINDLVDSLRTKSIDKMKRFYREEIDVLLVDDIQFLQNRLNFEEEFYNMFETLVKAGKQIVITSDKPPGELNLSERMKAWFEWSLVAHMGPPDLETRVAILLNKAELKGLDIPSNVAFYICSHLQHNIRQLEGAVNRICAHNRLMNLKITEDSVEQILKEIFQKTPKNRISVEEIIKEVASVFQVRHADIKGAVRTKKIVLSRQVAMYLAKEMIKDSLISLGAYFGKTHSTILHACKNIEVRLQDDNTLRRQIDMIRRHLAQC